MQVSQDASRRYSRSRSRSTSRTRKPSRRAAIVPLRRRSFNLYGNVNQIFRCQRTTTWQCGYSAVSGFTNLAGSVIYGSGLGLAFKLSEVNGTGNLVNPGVLNAVPNYTEFTALFDYYRIKGVHIKMIYTNNVANTTAAVGTASAIALPTVQGMYDLDDGNAPTTEGELLQRPGVRLETLGTNGPLNFYVKAKYANQILTDAGVQPAGIGASSDWLDGNFPGIPHFGYKLWLTPWAAAPALQQGYFQFFFTYDLEFKGMR